MGGGRAGGEPSTAPLAQVVVSKPLSQDIETRLSFLGQFAAVSQVELRAQVGGTRELRQEFVRIGTLVVGVG